MGWVTMSLRRSELQASVQDLQFEILQLSRTSREIGKLSQAMADGRITPAEIGSLGSSVFLDAMEFSEISHGVASEIALSNCEMYADLYSGITQDQYYNSPALAAQATLYFDQETGALNTQAIYAELYEQELENYVNEVVMPELKELEQQIADEKLEKETLLQQEEAELDSLKQSISEEISRNTIQL